MTEMQLKGQELEFQKEKLQEEKRMHSEDVKQRDRTANKQMIGNIIGGVLGAGAKLATGGLASNNRANALDVARVRAEKGNSPEWYNQNKSLVESVANLSYDAPLGSTYINGHSVAGVCIFDYVPMLPHTAQVNNVTEYSTWKERSNVVDDTLMTSFHAMYAKIRKANSGARNYEPKDLVKYVIAIMQMYNTLSEGKKIYDLVQTFDSSNLFFGRRLMEAYNISPSVIGDLPKLKAALEFFGQAIKTYTITTDMTVLARQTWLNAAVYSDNAMTKSQFYMFRPVGYYVIKDALEVSLQFKVYPWIKLNGSAFNVTEFTSVCQTILDGLLEDPFAGIISGDIRKAFGDSNVYSFTSDIKFVPLNPLYSEEVLSQIENMRILGFPSYRLVDGLFDITQSADNSRVIYQTLPGMTFIKPPADITSVPSVTRQEEDVALINMYKDNPTPDDIMVATRLQTRIGFFDNSANNTLVKAVTSCGTEIILNARILYVQKPLDGSSMTTKVINFCSFMYYTDISGGLGYPEAYPIEENLPVLSQFDWLPAFYGVGYKPVDNSVVISRIIGEFKNVASLSWDKQQALHKVAGLSEFGLALFDRE